jgi:hypothetical protein
MRYPHAVFAPLFYLDSGSYQVCKIGLLAPGKRSYLVGSQFQEGEVQ